MPHQHPSTGIAVVSANLQTLASDILAQGQREPIVLYDGLILDGRNRYRACAHIGIDPLFTTYDGNDPTAYVISLNLRRRHLNESQRAMVAAKLANIRLGDYVGNQHDREGSANWPTPRNDNSAPVSQSSAASMLNVAERSVRRAVEVRDNAIPDLAQAVDRGEVSVSAAATVARLEHDEQRGIIEHGPAAVREAATSRHWKF